LVGENRGRLQLVEEWEKERVFTFRLGILMVGVLRVEIKIGGQGEYIIRIHAEHLLINHQPVAPISVVNH